MKIYFVRHGESVANKEGWVAGRLDPPLTILGREQAREAGEQLVNSNTAISTVVASNMIRAQQTAEIIIEQLAFDVEYVSLPEFSERSFGDLHGTRKSNPTLHTSPDTYFAELEKAGGEGSKELDRRVAICMKKFESLQAPVLAIGHSGFTRHLRLRYDPTCSEYETLLDLPRFENGQLHEFELVANK